MVEQYEIILDPFPKGCHVITELIISNISRFPETGVMHLFIKHTSAAITINEGVDKSVRNDMYESLNRLIKEREAFYTHTAEGDDDIPAHIKSSLIGSSITIPITNFKLNLGMWQAIYLCEFRKYGGNREFVATVMG